jgi:hypothetical protein
VSRWTRYGIATSVSGLLGTGAGLLGNAFADGWHWPVGIGLGVMVVADIGWSAWHETRPRTADSAEPSITQVGPVSATDGGQAIGINYGTVERGDPR